MAKYGMLKLARVRDIMTGAVVFVIADTSAREAARTLGRHRIQGAPVLGEHGRIVGMISNADLADADETDTAGARMTRVVYAVRADDPAMVAVQLMVKEQIHRAIVVDDAGSMVGIVAPIDVLRALTRGARLHRLDEDGAEDEVEFVDLRRHAGASAHR